MLQQVQSQKRFSLPSEQWSHLGEKRGRLRGKICYSLGCSSPCNRGVASSRVGDN